MSTVSNFTKNPGRALIIGSSYPGNAEILTVAVNDDTSGSWDTHGGPSLRGDFMDIPLKKFGPKNFTRVVFSGCCPIVEKMGGAPCQFTKAWKWAQEVVAKKPLPPMQSIVDFAVPLPKKCRELTHMVLESMKGIDAKDPKAPQKRAKAVHQFALELLESYNAFSTIEPNDLAAKVKKLMDSVQPGWVFFRHCDECMDEPTAIVDCAQRERFIKAFTNQGFQTVFEFHPPLKLTERNPGEDIASLTEPTHPKDLSKWEEAKGGLIFFLPKDIP